MVLHEESRVPNGKVSVDVCTQSRSFREHDDSGIAVSVCVLLWNSRDYFLFYHELLCNVDLLE